MAKWFMAAKKADFAAISKKYQIDPVIARIMRNRDIITDEQIEAYLYADADRLHDPNGMKDIQKAAFILCQKIKENKKIRIIGDYDVDGICAAYILYRGLTLCKADVDTKIPHRIKDGYGINEQFIKNAIRDDVDTIVTCDNGIAEREAFLYASNAGLTCIITDHHEIPYEEEEGKKRYLLPMADAIVDPKQEDCSYPYKQLCGAAVAFKVIEVLLEQCKVELSLQKEILRELIELAGVATICDVMELRGENRILVKTALACLKEPKNIGLEALMKVNGIDQNNLSAYHIGFILGPCMNATGRLDTAKMALELLLSNTPEEAAILAARLKELNESRKEMTRKGVETACQIASDIRYQNDMVLVLYLPDIHESLAGIIAGRVREAFHRPVFILTKGVEEVKGSARSIEAYSMYEEMTKCKELFIRYGGHKMAAGLSIKEENIDVFRRKINELCTLTPEDCEEKIVIDVPMPLSYVTKQLVEQLTLLEPFGVGNEKPVFAQKNVCFISAKTMGSGNMAKFTVQDETGRTYELLLFRDLERFVCCVEKKYGKDALETLFSPNASQKKDINVQPLCFHIIYYPSINCYRGKETIQFVLQDYQ